MRQAGRLALAIAVGIAATAAVAAGAYALSHVWTDSSFVAFVAVTAAVAATVVAALWVDPALIICGGVALSVFSGNWQHIGLPGGMDHVVLTAGILALLLRAVRRPDKVRVELRPLHLALAVLSLYAIGSALWAGTLLDHESFFSLADKLGVVPFALFFVAPAAFRTERQRLYLLATLVALGAYLGVIAVLEVTGPEALVIPHYITDPNVGIHADRARGPFVEAGANGLALFICGVAGAIGLRMFRSNWARVAAGSVALLSAVGVVLTLTRQVWLAAAAGTIVALAFAPSLRRYLPLAVAGLVTVALGTLFFVPDLSKKADERAGDKSPVWDRLNSDKAAAQMVEQRPLLGFGWGTFGARSPDYYRVAKDYPLTAVSSVHNVFLSNAAELGLLGALLWLGASLVAFLGPMRGRAPPGLELWRAGLVAVVVAWVVQANFTPLSYAFPNSMLWLWAGVASVGLASSPARARRVKMRSSRSAELATS